MKQLIKNILIFCFFIYISIILVILYVIPHEFIHWTSCKLLGLDGTIKINLSKPDFFTICNGISNKNDFAQFIFSSSPYFFNFLILISFLFFYKNKNVYFLALPSAILFSDLLSLFIFLFYIPHPVNDFLKISYLSPIYLIILIFLNFVNLSITILIWHNYFIKSPTWAVLRAGQNLTDKNLLKN